MRATRRSARARAKAAVMGDVAVCTLVIATPCYSLCQCDAEGVGDSIDVFVAAAGEVDDDHVVGTQRVALAEGEDVGDGVGGLQRGDDALIFAQGLEGAQG